MEKEVAKGMKRPLTENDIMMVPIEAPETQVLLFEDVEPCASSGWRGGLDMVPSGEISQSF